jgi:phage-related protein
MIDIFADMESAMKGMSIAEQDHYKKTILGVEGMTAYNAAMQATVEVMDNGVKKTLKGVEAVKYMENELKNSGGATAAFAEIQKSTWEGAQEMLSGTWTTIKLVFGQTFIPALTAATQAVTAILNPILEFMMANEGVRKAIAWTAAGAAGFLLFGGAVMVARGFFGLLRLTALASMSPFRQIGTGVAFLKTQLLGVIPFIKAKTVALWQKIAALTASGVSALKSGSAFVWHKTAMIAGAVATKVMAAAQWALNAAFIASPVGWIVLGILALGAAVYGIVKYWDLIKEKAVGAWNWIKSVWGGAPDWVKGLIVVITAPISIPILMIYKYWGQLKSFFSGVWSTIRSGFVAVIGFVTSALSSAWNAIAASFSAVAGVLARIFTVAWNAVKAGMAVAISAIVNIVVPAFGRMWNLITSGLARVGRVWYNLFIAPFVKVWGYLSGFFGSIWDYVYNAGAKIISTLWDGIKSKAADFKNGVKDVFSSAWRLFAQSDAPEGPFSKLTYSGQAIIKTLNSGIEQEGNKTPAVLPYMKKSADILQDQSIVSNGSSPGGMNAAGGFVLNAGNLIGTLNLKGTSKSGNINELAQAMANLLYEQFLRAQNA